MTATALGVGVHRNVPADVYHALPYASASRLKLLRRSPAHLRASLDASSESSAALRLGRAAHTSVLEPHLFDTEFTVAAQCTAITKDGKGPRCTNGGTFEHPERGWLCGVHAKGVAISSARTVLPGADHATCLGLRAAVLAHPLAANLLRAAGDIELTLVWDDPETGVRCKARPDLYAPNVMGGVFGDLKTCDDARADAFTRSVVNYGYALQDGHYLDGAAVLGLPVERFVFFCAEKPAPHGVCLYEIDPSDLLIARDEVHALLRTWATCFALDEFPCYPAEVRTLTLPSYAWRASHEPLTMETASV